MSGILVQTGLEVAQIGPGSGGGQNFTKTVIVNLGGGPIPGVISSSVTFFGFGVGTSVRSVNDAIGDTSNSDAGFTTRRARGTATAPAAVQNGDRLGIWGASAYAATGYLSGSRAYMEALAAGTWTDTSAPTTLAFATTSSGSTAATVRWTISSGGHLLPETDDVYTIGADTFAPQQITAARFIKTRPLLVLTLPSAVAAGAGARAYVTNATATLTAGIGTVVAGGGANKVPVVSDGADWIIG